MPEILKRMAYHNIERNQPFIAHSLTFNGRKLVTPDSEVEIWICRDAILGTVQVLADSGDEFEERMHVALEDVKGMEVVDSPEGHDGAIRRSQSHMFLADNWTDSQGTSSSSSVSNIRRTLEQRV